MDKQQLQGLLQQNEFGQIIEVFQNISPKLGKTLQNQVTMVASQYNGYLKDKHAGTESREDLDITLNRLRASINYTIEQLPTEVSPLSGNEQKPTADLPQQKAPVPKPQTINGPAPSSPNPNIPWVIGLTLLAAILTLLMIVPCPTSQQFFAFRLTLALAAGGLATMLPGMLKFEASPGLKAGGAIGLAALIWMVNPKSFVSSDACSQKPFTLTVRLEAPDLPNYPPLADAQLKLWQHNEWRPATVSPDLVADFKNLDVDLIGKKVPVQLAAKFWKLAADSLTIGKESATLPFTPDGSLSLVEGRTVDFVEGGYIKGVKVVVAGMSMTTDEYGKYYFKIPAEQQELEYQFSAKKEGYEPVNKTIYPSDKTILLRMKKL